jgi:hypothetical protein
MVPGRNKRGPKGRRIARETWLSGLFVSEDSQCCLKAAARSRIRRPRTNQQLANALFSKKTGKSALLTPIEPMTTPFILHFPQKSSSRFFSRRDGPLQSLNDACLVRSPARAET